MKKRILIWGTGSNAIYTLENYSNIMKNFDIIAFISKEKKEKFLEKEVILPESIKFYQWDYIVILSTFEKEIRNQATKIYKINNKLIMNISELCYFCLNSYIGNIIQDFSTLEIIESVAGENDINFQYLKKNYSQILENTYNEQNDLYINCKNIKIWVCWLQGFENAPKLVQCCLKSIYKYLGGGKEEKLLKLQRKISKNM